MRRAWSAMQRDIHAMGVLRQSGETAALPATSYLPVLIGPNYRVIGRTEPIFIFIPVCLVP